MQLFGRWFQKKSLELAKGIEVGSGVPDKNYESKEVYELIHVAKCFLELREKRKVNN